MNAVAAAASAMADLAKTPLILPTGPHGLRSTLDAAFARAGIRPVLAAEIDSLALLMEAVDAGLGCTVQPWAAVARFADAGRRFHLADALQNLLQNGIRQNVETLVGDAQPGRERDARGSVDGCASSTVTCPGLPSRKHPCKRNLKNIV